MRPDFYIYCVERGNKSRGGGGWVNGPKVKL